MDRRRRRAIYYIGALAAIVVFYVFAYRAGMAAFQGESRSIAQSLLVVVESITTTGYGEDAANWTAMPMVLLVTLMNFTGVVFIFMALPLFVVPWLEERLATTLPERVTLEDHVVIASYTARSQELLDELRNRNVPSVVIESDRETGESLARDGEVVIQGSATEVETLRRANLGAARTLVADIGDEANATVALAADECAPDVDVITFVEDPENRKYHEYAGAKTVFSPRHLVAESLAAKITSGVTTDLSDAVEITDDFEIVEIPVQANSDLAGRTVAESGIRERTGANIVGAWFHGEFAAPPAPEATIDARTILLVAGREHELERLKQFTLSEKRHRRRGDVLICGFGAVGSTIKRNLTAANIDARAIDLRDKSGVDVVGDVTDHDTFEEADTEDVSTVIMALPDDRQAVFATLVVREMSEDVEVLARANGKESVGKLYRAGADYVLALSTVSGRMLASTILDEDVISFGQQIDVERLEAHSLAGSTLESANIPATTGCTVVAVERDGDVITDLDPSFRFEATDEIVVVGPDDCVADLYERLSE